MVKVDIDGALDFLKADALQKSDAYNAVQRLNGLSGTGWVNLPSDYNAEISRQIKAAAAKIAAESEVLIVTGIGGSYLGARALLDYIKSPFYNDLPKTTPAILFAGNNVSGEYLRHIIELIGDRDFSVNVVSKSGSTLETAAALRVLSDLLLSRYGSDGLRSRLYITTDKHSPLHNTALQNDCACFELPADVGGRYSVLSAVGLLPAAVAGIDIDEIMSGAREEMETGLHDACLYAAARQTLYKSGKKIELLASFEPNFRMTGEWWKQIFGESEGKEHLGIFPAYADYTADLHSLGQYVQDGERTLIETFVTFNSSSADIEIPAATIHNDGLDAITGLGLNDLNRAASRAVKQAHIAGGVPIIELVLPEQSPASFGALAYFFERSCAVSALLSGVDPFGQPGVEAYKKNLYAILGLQK